MAKRWRRRRAVTVQTVTSLQYRAIARRKCGYEFQSFGPPERKDRSSGVLIFTIGTVRVGISGDRKIRAETQTCSKSARGIGRDGL